MSIETDELARRAFSGDQQAWRLLYDAMTPRLFGLVRRMGASVEDAAEVVQEAWLRVIRHQENYDRARRFEAFAFTIAARLWIDVCRHRKVLPQSAGLPEDAAADAPLPLEQLFAVERTEKMVHCMESLTTSEREILVMRFWEDLSHREVGERIGTTTESAKGKAFRAVRKLADCMNLEQFEQLSPPSASAPTDAP